MNTIPVRFDVLHAYAEKNNLDYNDLCRWVRTAIAEGSTDVSKVALDIAKWFVNGDKPDEWKLKEWAERLDRDAIQRAYADRSETVAQPVSDSGQHGSPSSTDDGQMNKDKQQ